MGKHASVPAQGGSDSAEDVGHFGVQMGEALVEQQRALALAAGEALEEGWRFAGERLVATADYLHALRDCATPPDWMELNQRFFSAAMDDVAHLSESMVGHLLERAGARAPG